MSRTALGVYSFTHREIKVQLTQILFTSWWPHGLWYEKGACKQSRSDCYKYLSLSSLSSFWLCFTPKASFLLGHSTSVSVECVLGSRTRVGLQGFTLGQCGMELIFHLGRERLRTTAHAFPKWDRVSTNQSWRSQHVLWCPLVSSM